MKCQKKTFSLLKIFVYDLSEQNKFYILIRITAAGTNFSTNHTHVFSHRYSCKIIQLCNIKTAK